MHRSPQSRSSLHVVSSHGMLFRNAENHAFECDPDNRNPVYRLAEFTAAQIEPEGEGSLLDSCSTCLLTGQA